MIRPFYKKDYFQIRMAEAYLRREARRLGFSTVAITQRPPIGTEEQERQAVFLALSVPKRLRHGIVGDLHQMARCLVMNTEGRNHDED